MDYYSSKTTTTTKSEQRVKQAIESAQRTTEEALEHGRRALNGLATQGEILQSAEDTVESNEYTLDKSMKILRGMTWSGMFYNVFNSDPEPKDVQGNQKQQQQQQQGAYREGFSSSSSSLQTLGADGNVTANYNKNSSINNNTSTSNSVGSGLTSLFGFVNNNSAAAASSSRAAANKNELMSGATTAPASATASSSSSFSQQQQDPELLGLSRNIDTLLNMSYELGDQIESQNRTLGRIEDKTNRVHDKTLAVTLRSSQLSERATGAPAALLGIYQFVEAGTAKYLAVVGEDIVWVRQSDRSTFFNCFLKANNIVGVQSAKTLKYLGMTMWGTVRASGNYFGKSEECYIDLDGRPTGLAFLATNWGGGGWLKQPRQLALQERLEAEEEQEQRQRNQQQRQQQRQQKHEQEDAKPKLVFPLDSVSGSLTDRTGSVITLHAVQASAGDIDWNTDRNKDPS